MSSRQTSSVTSIRADIVLRKAVERIKRHDARRAEDAWQQGKELLTINERQLWRLGCDENGLALFPSFERWFLAQDFDFTLQYGYIKMAIARAFRSPDMVARIGVSKAAKLACVDEDERRRLLPFVADWNKEQVQRAITEWRAKTGSMSAHTRAGVISAEKRRQARRPDAVVMHEALLKIVGMLDGHQDPSCRRAARIAKAALNKRNP